MRVSTVIAALDEQPTIARVVRGCLSASDRVVEVVVVDDGSTDGTAEAAASAGARVVRLARNAGKGRAIRRGIAEATGDVLLFLDADGQDDPAEIPRLLDALTPGVSMVIGSRFVGRFRAGAISPLNRAGSRMLTESVNLLYRARVTDAVAGFRCVTRRALDGCALSADGYDIEVELLCQVLRNGGRVAEVPVTRSARRHGRSHLRSVRDGARMLRRIVRLRL